MYRLEEFRTRVQELSQRAMPYEGRRANSTDLAAAIGLSREELSRRLNGKGKTKLDNSNIRAIVRTLAEWGAITTRAEALELFSLVGCPPFTASEWQSPPLDLLTPASQSDKHRHNLPTPLTSFIGRKGEVEYVYNLLRQPDVRLVTLTGTGGTGKTRLGIQLAGELADEYDDGTYFVALAAVIDPRLVAPTIAQALGLKEKADESLTDSLKGYLRERQMLLVIDNFEQVIEVAPLMEELLVAAKHTKMLVTSRERLHIYGEHNFVVPPLVVPGASASAEEVAQNPAAQLFIQRAQAALPGFRLTARNAPIVAEISNQLEGLPLAIELAAAQIRFFGPEQILKRLSDRFDFLSDTVRGLTPKQHSLRSAIDWSYGLLTAHEQQLFRRLSVFVGGCTIEAVEAVFQSEGREARDYLSSLVDKSLLQAVYIEKHEETRFMMLETIREYAQAKLMEYGEAELAQKLHTEYYCRLVTQAEPELIGPQQIFWLHRLDIEYDNIRAALRWAELSSPQQMAEIAAYMGRFWSMRGYLNEGVYWLRKSAQSELDVAKGARLLILRRLGQISHHKGDYAQARECFSELLSLASAADDDLNVAHALINMATVVGDANTSLELLAKALPLYQAVGDQPGQADVYRVEGNIASDRGNYEQARELYFKSLALRRELGQPAGVALELGNIARLCIDTGEYSAALPLLQEELECCREAGLTIDAAPALNNLAKAHFHLGNYSLAKQYFHESATTSYNAGNSFGLSGALEGYAYLTASTGNYASAAVLLAVTSRIDRSISEDLSVGERAEYLAENPNLASQQDEALIALNWVRRHYAGLNEEVKEDEVKEWMANWRIGETMPIEAVLSYMEKLASS